MAFDWLSGINAALATLPSVFAAVTEIVEVIEVKGAAQGGDHKKRTALDAIRATIDTADAFDDRSLVTEQQRAGILGVASASIDLWVGYKNVVGAFERSANAPQEVLATSS